MTTLLAILLVVLVLPSVLVALMLARAAAVLDRQEEAELDRFRHLRVVDVAPEAELPVDKAAGE